MNRYILPVCMNMNIMCASSLLLSEDGLRTPDLEVMSCCWSKSLQEIVHHYMEEQQELFNAELSLSFPKLLIYDQHSYYYYFCLSICSYLSMHSLLVQFY